MPFLLAVMMLATTSPSVLTAHLILPPVSTVTVQKEAWLDALAECENRDHVKKILDRNNRFSYADYMFQMSTWLEQGKKFGATRENIASSSLQRIVARDMLNRGMWKRWYHCSLKIHKKLGLYPVGE